MPGSHRSYKLSTSWLFNVPSIVMLGLFALPLAALTGRSARKESFTYAFSPAAIAVLRLSMGTSLAAVLITILLGTPLAYILARWKFPLKQLVELLFDLPVILPPSVAGLALLIAFSRQGTFGSALAMLNLSLPFTSAAVVVAQTFVAAPLYVRSTRRISRQSRRNWKRRLLWKAPINGSFLEK